MRMRLNISSSTIAAAAIALLMFVFGFAYGNLFDALYDFKLKEWQVLGSTLVAILAATLAYYGVTNTQRITVMIKEQDRIYDRLPGMRQVADLLHLISTNMKVLDNSTRYMAYGLLRDILHPQEGDNYR
jgi:hypothetical protein